MSDVVSWAGLLFLGSAVVNGGGSGGGVQVFCAPRMCGVGETLEQVVLFVGIMSPRAWHVSRSCNLLIKELCFDGTYPLFICYIHNGDAST